jgi:hypothetical protein
MRRNLLRAREDDTSSVEVAPQTIESTEALTKTIERRDFCHQSVEIEIRSCLNALGRDDEERPSTGDSVPLGRDSR